MAPSEDETYDNRVNKRKSLESEEGKSGLKGSKERTNMNKSYYSYLS